jgi:hypothetical protein
MDYLQHLAAYLGCCFLAAAFVAIADKWITYSRGE